MKRSFVIACCLLLIFASLASAWAECKQVAVTGDHIRRLQVLLPAEEHHSKAQHDHSHGTVIHCATLDEFVRTSTFLLTKDHRGHLVTDPFIAAQHSAFSRDFPHWLIHGPPGLPRLNIIPQYLLLSAFRI